uniref:Uncharacterized protein n=1 Tax=Rhipicephalus zambeziensis TaxID=60191 RepID=A0A224YK81_9ACAR
MKMRILVALLLAFACGGTIIRYNPSCPNKEALKCKEQNLEFACFVKDERTTYRTCVPLGTNCSSYWEKYCRGEKRFVWCAYYRHEEAYCCYCECCMWKDVRSSVVNRTYCDNDEIFNPQ